MPTKEGVFKVLHDVCVWMSVCPLAFELMHACGRDASVLEVHFGLPSLSAPLNPTTLFLRSSSLFSKGAHFL